MVSVSCTPHGSLLALPLLPLVCCCMVFASQHPWALRLWCGSSCIPHCPAIVTNSTCNPSCEQLLTVAGVGADLVIPVSLSCGVGVVVPLIALPSLLIAPAIPHASSCSQWQEQVLTSLFPCPCPVV